MTNRTLNASTRLLLRMLLVLLLLTPMALLAQGTAATVSGFVTDSTGAKIPGATVTYTNTATGVSGTAVTNGAGLYRISGLQPGTYKSTATIKGFKTEERDGIDLQVEAQILLDFTLNVGAVSDTVTVEASATVLCAASTSNALTEEVPMSSPRNVSCARSTIAASLEAATINKKPRPCRRGSGLRASDC